MDLETENRIAALIMQEATKLRLQAEKEGVHVYLQQPKVRCRPNTRFLTATVLGVQQSNRAADVDEMWRIRKKELELDEILTGTSRSRGVISGEHNRSRINERGSFSAFRAREGGSSASQGQNHSRNDDGYSEVDVGLRDEEIEEFLHSRRKRGRGAVGPRMDETGPYMKRSTLCSKEAYADVRVEEEWEKRILGPERPPFLEKFEEPVARGYPAYGGNTANEEDLGISKKRKSKDRHKSRKDKSRSKNRKGKKNRRDKKSKHVCGQGLSERST